MGGLSKKQKTDLKNRQMNNTEQQFSQLVKDNRSTIYSVCYMFSNDADEVADLFQEVLVKAHPINLGD